MWQKCPICNGTGNHNQPYANATSGICKVCGGKGIISELTGLPPKGVDVPKDSQEISRVNHNSSSLLKDDPGYNIVQSYYNK